MKFKLTLLAFVLVIISASFWLTNKIEQTASQNLKKGPNKRPDYYMNNFIVHGTDIAGLAKFRLMAEHLEHFPYDDHSDLLQPKMLFYMADGPPWRVRATTGRITSKNQRIILFGEVHIIRAKSETAPKTVIVTEELHFKPEKDFLSTTHEVKYTSGLNKIIGDGLRADLKNGHFRILKNVKASYAPPK